MKLKVGIRKMYVTPEKCNPEGRLKDSVQKTGSSTFREFRAINALKLQQTLHAQKYTFFPPKSYQTFNKCSTNLESQHY